MYGRLKNEKIHLSTGKKLNKIMYEEIFSLLMKANHDSIVILHYLSFSIYFRIGSDQ